MQGNLKAHRPYYYCLAKDEIGAALPDDSCKEFLLRRLLHCQSAYHVQLHAYCLMERRILLLFTPRTPSGFTSYCNFLLKSYRGYYGVRFDRHVDSQPSQVIGYQLMNNQSVRDAQKFIERFEQRTSGAQHSGAYRYSSYCANAFIRKPRHLTRHVAFAEMLSATAGLGRYRKFISAPFSAELERFLDRHLLSADSEGELENSPTFEKRRVLTDIEKSGTIAMNSESLGVRQVV